MIVKRVKAVRAQRRIRERARVSTLGPVEPLPQHHTDRWCNEAATTILLGPDRECPACRAAL